MSDFIQRLVREKSELEKKRDYLETFRTSSTFNNVNPVQQSLLYIQLHAMNTYIACLQERLVFLSLEQNTLLKTQSINVIEKYQKIPLIIEACQWTGKNTVEIIRFCTSGYISYPLNQLTPVLKIQTLEGLFEATVGDYIIKGIEGEFYPCKENIFLKSYNKTDK